MKYKLIATDMDGTLLTPDDKITEATVSAIKKAIEKGVIFTLCTGRPLQGVNKIHSTVAVGLSCNYV